jgi:hypothetical protein
MAVAYSIAPRQDICVCGGLLDVPVACLYFIYDKSLKENFRSEATKKEGIEIPKEGRAIVTTIIASTAIKNKRLF